MEDFDLAVARDLIPANVRRWIYAVLSLTGVVLTAVVSGYAASGSVTPSWVTIGLSVLGVLAGPFGFLAASNTSVNKQIPIDGEVIDTH